MADRMLKAECRRLVVEHGEALKHICEEVMAEAEKRKITGSTAFDYARETIRSQGIQEGLHLLQVKINKYSDDK